MKNFKSGKKIISAIAALAISATAIGGVLSVIKLSDNHKTGIVVDYSDSRKSVVVDTALGQTTSTVGNKYYVSPNAERGDASNDGSLAHPYNIYELLEKKPTKALQPGDTLYVLPGVYKMSDAQLQMHRDTTKGTFDKYIRIVNAALEKDASGYDTTKYPGTEAVLDFSAMRFDSTNRGVSIDTDYIYWYGIDVRGAGDNGMYIGGSYNTIEYSEFYNNRDTGLQLGRSENFYNEMDQWPSYNLVKNCTSHNNYDYETFGENADGFAAKLTVGFGNVFDGCIAYRNSDDGWDLYAKTDSGNIGAVIIYNCVAFENGYLEYTRDECYALYPTFDKDALYANDPSSSPYETRDGDGNGFKLGGSIMEGDVILYNCLSFNNRMHGVTDNSNPGYIKSTYVTAYNNSAAVDVNGKVVKKVNADDHSNIDVSRQYYSYNSVNNVLSVRDDNALSLDKDRYRGTVINSLLDAKTNTNVIKGSMEGDTINGKISYTSQIDLLVAKDMFKALPNDSSNEETTLRGNNNSMTFGDDKAIVMKDGKEVVIDIKVVSSMNSDRVHVKYRNADQSINMGDVLAKSDKCNNLIAANFDEGVTLGSDLNLSSWDKYVHFYENDLINGSAESQEWAWVERAKEALTINTVEAAVYQDIEVPVKMLNAEIKWSTTDIDYLTIRDAEDEIAVSSSGSQYAIVQVWRDAKEDKHVTLTATITYGSAEVTKVFNLTLIKGDPSVGTVFVEDGYGNKLYDGDKYIQDQYKYYREPAVRVQNGLYPDSVKLLSEEFYDVKTTYMYQVDANSHAVEIKEYTPSVGGVYTITHSVSLKGSNQATTMSYKLYIASPSADVDFENGVSLVTANRGGYAIAGSPSSATGILYAVSSTTELTDITADNIKTYQGATVTEKPFRDTYITFNFDNANTASYNVYYALANANGEITSPLYTAQINRVDVDTADKFVTIAGGGKLDGEEPSQTIYAITKDLNLSGKSFTGKNTFTGVINGMGHTISNLSSKQYIFYKVNGGTIMNLKVNNLSITATETKVGFISECLGGDFYNLAFTNVNISSTNQRVGGLIGHVGDSKGTGCDLTISQVSLVNSDDNHQITGSQRVGGLVAFVQAYEHTISIDNCYVVTNIEASTTGEGSGMVATWEDRAADKLIISQCYYSGNLKTGAAPGSSRLGGMLGYHKGGAGELEITRCISLAKLYIQTDEQRTESVKNASPIVGNFSTSQNTVVSVTYCIGLMQEYNDGAFDVMVFSETNLKRNSLYITDKDYLNLDIETRWTVVETEEFKNLNEEERKNYRLDRYEAPYVILNFLTDPSWN